MSVDTRSSSLAYSTKNNIVYPYSAAQATAAELAAATRASDGTNLGQDTVVVQEAIDVTVTLRDLLTTKHIKR